MTTNTNTIFYQQRAELEKLKTLSFAPNTELINAIQQMNSAFKTPPFSHSAEMFKKINKQNQEIKLAIQNSFISESIQSLGSVKNSYFDAIKNLGTPSDRYFNSIKSLGNIHKTLPNTNDIIFKNMAQIGEIYSDTFKNLNTLHKSFPNSEDLLSKNLKIISKNLSNINYKPSIHTEKIAEKFQDFQLNHYKMIYNMINILPHKYITDLNDTVTSFSKTYEKSLDTSINNTFYKIENSSIENNKPAQDTTSAEIDEKSTENKYIALLLKIFQSYLYINMVLTSLRETPQNFGLVEKVILEFWDFIEHFLINN